MHANRRRIHKKKMEVLKKIVIFIAFLGAEVYCLSLYASSKGKDQYIAFSPHLFTRDSIYIIPESNYSSDEYYLQISWLSFRVDDEMPSCLRSYVKVYLGRYSTSTGKLCSNNAAMPFTMYSWTGSASMFYFVERSGYFEFRYQLKSKSSELLGSLSPPFSTKNLNSSSGVLFSRNWPIYHQSSSCTYTIKRPTSYEVTKIVMMDRDFPYDKHHNIEIRGSNISTSKFTHVISREVYSFENFIVNDRYIQIKFTWSNRTGDKYDRGFVAGYISYNLTSPPPTTTTTTIYATTFREYKYFSNSSYGTIYIKPSTSKYFLHWDWPTFRVKGDMPSCATDYVEVYLTRSYKSIGKFCSNNAESPFDMYSHDGYAKIIYKASNSSGVQFVLSYKLMSKTYASKCTGAYGYRDRYSRNWPQSYLPSSIPCRYVIQRPSTYDVTKIIFMDLDLHSSASYNDYIELRGSNTARWNYATQIRIFEHTIETRIFSTSSIKTYTVYDRYIEIKFNRRYGSSSKRGFLLGYISYAIKKTDSKSKTQSSSSFNLATKTAIGVSAALFVIGIVLYLYIYKKCARVRRRNAIRSADGAPVSVTQTNITTTTTVFTNASIIGDDDAISDAIAADAPPSYTVALGYPPSKVDLQHQSSPPPPYESTISSTTGENVPVNTSYRAEYRGYASGNPDNETGNQDNQTRNQGHLEANQEYPTDTSTASVTLILPTARNQWVTFSSHGDQQTPSNTPIERNTQTQNEPLPDYDNVPPPAYNSIQN